MPHSSSFAATPFSALQAEIASDVSPLRKAISAAALRDETNTVRALLAQTAPDSDIRKNEIRRLARQLVSEVRDKRSRASGVDALMHEFSLSSEEGVALMCLAEALLRIPDQATADRLIADKIGHGDWRRHLGESPSLFVNAATWGLLITGKMLAPHTESGLGSALSRLIARGGEPLIRKGVDLAMRMLGQQFVAGRGIAEALANSQSSAARGYRHSYDMLGEAALTTADADRYYAAYENALHAIGQASNGRGVRLGPGISIKLSALHPRYCRAQRARVMQQLLPRLSALAALANHYDIGLNIDAEETDRLELSLDLLEALAFDPALDGFDGIGFVVQAYQKRAPFVVDYLIDLARRSGHRLMVRLVKGAYWDTEIKRAQVNGLSAYPVYTRKAYTDVCYLVCARKLLYASDCIYPQFATHNAQTLSVIYTWAKAADIEDYEFQCLHGMGETLYDQVVGDDTLKRPCRIYAPVGSHHTLLAYLVRRLLENGANASFVHQIIDQHIDTETLIADPFEIARNFDCAPHPAIALPSDLFKSERKNSSGLDFGNDDALREMAAAIAASEINALRKAPLLDGPLSCDGGMRRISNPANHGDVVGAIVEASPADLDNALASAELHAIDWQITEPVLRAAALERAADLFETHRYELMGLAVREAGKSLPNALGEVREAVDFLRYYAARIRALPNLLALGPVACISPWNFPLAIFTGQVAAALAAGNVVLAKPAEQTPLIAWRAVELLHQAGIPRAALQLLPGDGGTVGAALCRDARVKGVIFTGSTDVARQIQRTLVRREIDEQCELVLIAETGGQNALIADSSALPEQLVQDVLASAFESAGQRCSALRVLFLQEEIADKTLTMLKGAMRELCVGNPDRLSTDIGPVIDAEARDKLLDHIERMKARAISHFSLNVDERNGTFIAPTLFEIASMAELPNEVFGPVLHVIRYRAEQLEQVIGQINASGYGLTFGVHSRIDATIDFVVQRIHAGNIYVNRNIIGAVVGVQPFGGEGLSGTGPKAGGPLYLTRLLRDAPQPAQRQCPTLPALKALAKWASAHGHARVAALADQYEHSTLLGNIFDLPGPTGERNTFNFAARGTALCVAQTMGVLLNQLAGALATGNRALVLSVVLPHGLPDEVKARIELADNIQACRDFQVAMIESELAPEIKNLLAAREGALVATLGTTEEGLIPLWRLLAERAVCVNTMAAGGNASLMTLDA
ncbi:MAG: bifunctional proline dehydrogenase/L-glutamate gamma-semialdehyde dehydrogenase PutA [Burkholderiaceae bacterium]|nr:bifunctional proline dehydrogenase/L-glutamate gamma-semialdehyde dehydrogenase PutA [Burkholderiaceae bacterium]